MYCSACGGEILGDAKFCPKCGKAVSIVENISPIVEAVPKDQEKKRFRVGKWLIVIILILVFPVFFVYGNSNLTNPIVVTVFIVIVLGFLVGVIWRFIKKYREGYLQLFRKIIKTIKYLAHHPKLTIFSLVASGVIVLLIYMVVIRVNYQSLEEVLPKIQDNLSETVTNKLMGDSIMSGRQVSGVSMGKIAKTTQTNLINLKQLPTSSRLNNYKMAIIDWSDGVAKAATTTATWKTLSENPPSFSLSLNDSKVKAYTNASLRKVASLKMAGDVAIKRQDRQTMYYVAGQLLVQQHWLNGILYSTNPGLISFRNFVSPVMAKYTGYTPVVYKGPRCIVFTSKGAYVPKNCPKGYQPAPISFNKAIQSALGYAAAKPEAEEQWNEVTADDLKIDLSNTGQYVETQDGVYNGEPNLPPQLSPTERIFVDECKAKGGTTGGTGGVYARMPTTETGMACHYGNGCWDYLTRTNRRYGGGNPGCPEENLLPPPPPPTATPRPTRLPTSIPPKPTTVKVSSWDGQYTTSMSGGCSGYDMSFSSGILPNSLTVKNNKVYTTLGSSTAINSSGYAQISSSVAGFSYSETFRFYSSGDGVTVQGTIRLPNVQGVSCLLNFSGRRQ